MHSALGPQRLQWERQVVCESPTQTWNPCCSLPIPSIRPEEETVLTTLGRGKSEHLRSEKLLSFLLLSFVYFFEIRTLCLLSRSSTAWAIPLILFALVILEMGVPLFAWDGLDLLFYASHCWDDRCMPPCPARPPALVDTNLRLSFRFVGVWCSGVYQQSAILVSSASFLQWKNLSSLWWD
jgi:hypothetical protein